MRQHSNLAKDPAEKVVKDIRRATRKQYSAEEKIRIVLEGLRGEDSIAELCRREGIAQNLYYRWSKDFLEAGKKRLAGDTARAATSDEVKDLRREATALKEVVADLTLENRLLKKSVTADGARPDRAWNRIPDDVRSRVVTLALDEPELSPRELAVRFTDAERYFVSEASVYRLLKAHDLITSPAFITMKAADEFKNKTTAPNQLWQTDFTYLKVTGWGWFYLSTILDDFSRYIIAWKLCTTMKACSRPTT
jgi:transposase-like protein